MAFQKKAKAPTTVVSGTVEKVSEKDAGTYTQVSILLNGEWYGKFGTLLKDETVVAGDVINLEVSQNGKYKNWESYEVVTKSSPKHVDTTKPGEAYNNNQFRFTYQGARNAAIELAALLISKDLLPIPTVKSKQIGAVMGFINEATKDFTLEAWNATPESLETSTGTIEEGMSE